MDKPENRFRGLPVKINGYEICFSDGVCAFVCVAGSGVVARRGRVVADA